MVAPSTGSFQKSLAPLLPLSRDLENSPMILTLCYGGAIIPKVFIHRLPCAERGLGFGVSSNNEC